MMKMPPTGDCVVLRPKHAAWRPPAGVLVEWDALKANPVPLMEGCDDETVEAVLCAVSANHLAPLLVLELVVNNRDAMRSLNLMNSPLARLIYTVCFRPLRHGDVSRDTSIPAPEDTPVTTPHGVLSFIAGSSGAALAGLLADWMTRVIDHVGGDVRRGIRSSRLVVFCFGMTSLLARYLAPELRDTIPFRLAVELLERWLKSVRDHAFIYRHHHHHNYCFRRNHRILTHALRTAQDLDATQTCLYHAVAVLASSAAGDIPSFTKHAGYAVQWHGSADISEAYASVTGGDDADEWPDMDVDWLIPEVFLEIQTRHDDVLSFLEVRCSVHDLFSLCVSHVSILTSLFLQVNRGIAGADAVLTSAALASFVSGRTHDIERMRVPWMQHSFTKDAGYGDDPSVVAAPSSGDDIPEKVHWEFQDDEEWRRNDPASSGLIESTYQEWLSAGAPDGEGTQISPDNGQVYQIVFVRNPDEKKDNFHTQRNVSWFGFFMQFYHFASYHHHHHHKRAHTFTPHTHTHTPHCPDSIVICTKNTTRHRRTLPTRGYTTRRVRCILAVSRNQWENT